MKSSGVTKSSIRGDRTFLKPYYEIRGPHLTDKHRAQHTTNMTLPDGDIVHIFSLVVPTTLNTYKYISIERSPQHRFLSKDLTRNVLITRKTP